MQRSSVDLTAFELWLKRCHGYKRSTARQHRYHVGGWLVKAGLGSVPLSDEAWDLATGLTPFEGRSAVLFREWLRRQLW